MLIQLRLANNNSRMYNYYKITQTYTFPNIEYSYSG